LSFVAAVFCLVVRLRGARRTGEDATCWPVFPRSQGSAPSVGVWEAFGWGALSRLSGCGHLQ